MPTHFIDTNILIYAVGMSPAEIEKRDAARALIELEGGALSVQVLQESYAQATRASRPHRLTHERAVALIETWTRFAVQDITLALLHAALEIKARTGLSYWDSAIVAAARALGCATLYSEDMQHGRVIDGVAITNPFL